MKKFIYFSKNIGNNVLKIIKKFYRYCDLHFTKYFWIYFCILVWLLFVYNLAPNPDKEVKFWIYNYFEFHAGTEDFVSGYLLENGLNVPPLYQNYNIVLQNRSKKECNQSLIINISRDSILDELARRDFFSYRHPDGYNREGELLHFATSTKDNSYEIKGGETITISGFPTRKGPIAFSSDLYQRGELPDGCRPVEEQYYDSENGLWKMYAKPSIPGLILDSFILLVVSFIFTASLRAVVTLNKIKNN